MSDGLRDRIAAAACGATSAGKLFPWETLSEAQRNSWRAVADAVIAEIDLGIPCAANGCRVRQIARKQADIHDRLNAKLEAAGDE